MSDSVEGSAENNVGIDIASLQAEIDRLKKHNETLIGESRSAKEKARLEAEKIAKEKGDFEALYKSSEEARQRLEQDMASLKQNAAKERIARESIAIASSLADGSNAELLQEFVSRRLTVSEDGSVKVVDQSGALTVSSLEDLKKEFVSSGKYNALLRPSKAEGGGATGDAQKSGAVKFSDMSEQERVRLYKQNPEEYRRLSGLS